MYEIDKYGGITYLVGRMAEMIVVATACIVYVGNRTLRERIATSAKIGIKIDAIFVKGLVSVDQGEKKQ